MRAQFLSDGSEFRSRSGGQLARGRRSNGMFWWTILITLLLGVATFCWIFSIMVFKYPEKPFNYKLLTRLHKLDPLVEFDRDKVPNGSMHAAKDLLKFCDLNGEQLRVKNGLLKRAFILNFREESPDYVKGTFTVLQARPLTARDVIAQGWVVRARSVDIEDVEIELLLPGAASDKAPYQDGQTFTLDNKATFAALLHLDRTSSGNDGICATVIPIVYGENLRNGDATIALEPPEKLNMEARWPVSDGVSAPGTKVAAKAQP